LFNRAKEQQASISFWTKAFANFAGIETTTKPSTKFGGIFQKTTRKEKKQYQATLDKLKQQKDIGSVFHLHLFLLFVAKFSLLFLH